MWEKRRKERKENGRYILHEKSLILLLQNKDQINIRNGQRKIEEYSMNLFLNDRRNIF